MGSIWRAHVVKPVSRCVPLVRRLRIALFLEIQGQHTYCSNSWGYGCCPPISSSWHNPCHPPRDRHLLVLASKARWLLLVPQDTHRFYCSRPPCTLHCRCKRNDHHSHPRDSIRN